MTKAKVIMVWRKQGGEVPKDNVAELVEMKKERKKV